MISKGTAHLCILPPLPPYPLKGHLHATLRQHPTEAFAIIFGAAAAVEPSTLR